MCWNYLTDLGVALSTSSNNTYAVVKRVTPTVRRCCGLCSRFAARCAVRYAAENEITKIALGHTATTSSNIVPEYVFSRRLKAIAQAVER